MHPRLAIYLTAVLILLGGIVPALGMHISPRSTEPGSAFLEVSQASQIEPLTHPHPAKTHAEQTPPCSKNRVGKIFSPKVNLHLADELPTQQLHWKIRLALAETASDDSIYANGNPISLSDPFGLVAAQNNFWGQVGDKIGALGESMFYASQDPSGASAAGVDHFVGGILGNATTGPVEPLKNAGLYQAGSNADRGGEFMSAYGQAVMFAAGASEAFGTPRGSVRTSGGMSQVTSWADAGITPDLAPGRWVQLGGATEINFGKLGYLGPKEFLRRSSHT